MGRCEQFYLLGDDGEKISEEAFASPEMILEGIQRSIEIGSMHVFSIGDQYYIVPASQYVIGVEVEEAAVAIVKIVASLGDDEDISAMLCNQDGTTWGS